MPLLSPSSRVLNIPAATLGSICLDSDIQSRSDLGDIVIDCRQIKHL